MRSTFFKLIIAVSLFLEIHPSFSQELPCKSYHPRENGGRCKERYSEDGDGEKHGKYIEYSETGQVVKRGSYNHGLKEGNWLISYEYYPSDYAWYVKGEIIAGSSRPINSYSEALVIAKETARKAEADAIENKKKEDAEAQAKEQKYMSMLLKDDPCLFIDRYPTDERATEAKQKCDEIRLQNGIREKQEREREQNNLADDDKFKKVFYQDLTFDEYTNEYPNGQHSKEIKDLQAWYVKQHVFKSDNMLYANNLSKFESYLHDYYSGFSFYSATNYPFSVKPKAKIFRDLTFSSLLERFQQAKDVLSIVKLYEIAAAENCSDKLLRKFPEWAKPFSSALSLTVNAKYSESTNILRSIPIDRDNLIKKYSFLIDFSIGINYLLQKDKSSSQQFLKRIYSTSIDPNANSGRISQDDGKDSEIYSDLKTLISLMVSDGMKEEALVKSIGKSESSWRSDGSKFYINKNGKIVWYYN